MEIINKHPSVLEFKAKKKLFKEEVTGFYVKVEHADGDRHMIFTGEEERFETFEVHGHVEHRVGVFSEIDVTTLRMYTGVCDANKKRIYGGDTIRVLDIMTGDVWIKTVRWEHGGFVIDDDVSIFSDYVYIGNLAESEIHRIELVENGVK